MQDPFELVRVPPRAEINPGLSPCRAFTLRRLLGEPRSVYSDECRPVANRELRARMVTARVGLFRVTGLDVAVESLQRAFDQLRQRDQAAWAAIGSAGMLCCRLVRGSTSTPSNHSWGIAIDLKVGGKLPTSGPNIPRALAAAADVLRTEGWYWGAGFTRRDPMHFELADQTLRRLLTGP